MATSPAVCGVCVLFNVQQQSVVWCFECDEGLCSLCKDHHERSKDKTHHRLIPIVDSGKLSPFDKIAETCTKHNEQNVFFCRKHCCSLCTNCLVNHECCKSSISSFKDEIDSKRTLDFTEVKTILIQVKENIDQLGENIEGNLREITEQGERLKQEIHEVRSKINCHLDKLEENICNELLEAGKNVKRQAEKIFKSFSEIEKQINDCDVSITTVMQYRDDLSEHQTFLGTKQIETDAFNTEKSMCSLIVDGKLNEFRLSFKVDETIRNLLDIENKFFGEIITLRRSTQLEDDIYSRIEQRRMRRCIVPRRPFGEVELTLLNKVDTKCYDVRRCAILTNGKMAISRCHYPSTLIIFNKDGSRDSEIDFTSTNSSVHGITPVDENTFAASAGGSGIKLIDLNSYNVKLTYSCTSFGGLAILDGHFVYCTKEKVIKMLDMIDHSVTSIPTKQLRDFPYISVFNSKVYYSDKSSNSVTCCDVKGRIIWKFKNTSVLLEPRGITVDKNGIVYVADSLLSKIAALSPDGQQSMVILDREDGVNEAWDLYCDRESNELLVVNGGGTMLVYNINYNEAT